MTDDGSPDPTRRELADVLRETRELLARPDNDFAWSSWEDADDALREIDGLITAVERGEVPGSVLFAPTGPIQEVSLSSGWGDEFLALADRWDAASAVAKLFRPVLPCDCTELGPPPGTFDESSVGVDATNGR
ncbi:MAG TPA: hypothetical protein VEW03_12970, partial [Longimicrobiaceae bacterium]|nr:hypothetical protein [Longimicrobiaceae bacterium]